MDTPIQGVKFDSNVASSFEGLSERSYLLNVFDYLIRNKFFSEHEVHIRSSNYANPPQYVDLDPSLDKKLILIYLSEDYRKIDLSLFEENYSLIFKCYDPQEMDVIPFPLGYESDASEYFDFVNWEDREINTFFSGNLNVNRISLYREVFNLHWVPTRLLTRLINSRFRKNLPSKMESGGNKINFSTSFKSGLIPRDYAHSLGRAKIAICPKGFHSVETFRHYEALRYGCIVISERLPRTWMYENSPIIQLDSWRDLNKTIKKLLASKDHLYELHQRSMLWWEEKLSPNAVAQLILDRASQLR